jgi:hypothetical protein
MKIKLDKGKKVFITCAIVTMVILSAISLCLLFRKNDELAEASLPAIKNVNVKIAGGNYDVGGKYSVVWDSDCRGGSAMVWLSSASSSKAFMNILVPLTKFSAADFGAPDADARIFFNDIWKINLSQTANNGKLSGTIPSNLYLDKSLFGASAGIYYLFTLSDGRIALQKMVKNQAQMPILPTTYYLRVDIKGKNGCVATGYSMPISIEK